MLHLQSAVLYFIPVFPNRNKGSETQTLKLLDFAGWDSEEQFYLRLGSTTGRQQPHTPNGSAEAVDKENTQVEKEIIPDSARREEKEVEISPGDRLSIRLVCQAKSVIFYEAARVKIQPLFGAFCEMSLRLNPV